MIQILDVVAACILVGYVVVGAVRGLWLTVLWLVGLVLAYVAAMVAPMLFTATVAKRFGMSTLLAGFILSLLAMFAVSVLIGGIRKAVLRKRLPSKGPDGKVKPAATPALSGSSRFLGGLLGGLYGIVITAVVGWCYDVATTGPMGAGFPDASTSMTARVSQKVMYEAVYLGIRQGSGDAAAARLGAALLSHPSRTFNGVSMLVTDPEVQQLWKDPAFLSAFLAGDAGKLATNDPLIQVLKDEHIVQTLQSIGLIENKRVESVPVGLAAMGAYIGPIASDPDVDLCPSCTA